MKIRWPGFDAKTVAAIEEYLRLDELTEIVWREDQGDRWDQASVERSGVFRYLARGRSTMTNHPRSMIDLIIGGASSAVAGFARPSCPDCDDWARTAKCEVHPELSLEEHRWQREFDRNRHRIDFGPGNNPELRPEPKLVGEDPFAVSALSAALESLRAASRTAPFNRYVYGFEVSNRGPVWTINTSA